jgi:transposase
MEASNSSPDHESLVSSSCCEGELRWSARALEAGQFHLPLAHDQKLSPRIDGDRISQTLDIFLRTRWRPQTARQIMKEKEDSRSVLMVMVIKRGGVEAW